MLVAVEAISYPVGQELSVVVNNKELFKGTVVACDRKHFTIQQKNYRDSFLKADVYTGYAKVTQFEEGTNAAK